MKIKTIIQIEESEIVSLLKSINNKDERRKVIRQYLNRTFAGKTISKEFADRYILIKNTKTDIKHLSHNEHLDTSIALTKVEDLIYLSEYINEKAISGHKVINYFWYFKIIVNIDDKCYSYNLNVGRNKIDGQILLYEINNYKKSNALTESQVRGVVAFYL